MLSLKKYTKLIIILILSGLLCGCWGKTDLDEKYILAGIGVDGRISDIKLSLQTIDPAQVGAGEESGSSGKDEEKHKVVITHGKTIFDALRNFSLLTGKKGFLSHVEVLVIGNKIAEEGIDKILDFFQRDHEFRYKMWVVISKSTAEEILNSEVPYEDITSFGISSMMKMQKNTSYVHAIDLIHISNELRIQKGNGVISTIHVNEENKSLELDGAAVFKNYKLIDWINNSLLRGFLFIDGEVDGGIIATKYNDIMHSIEISGTGNDFEVTFENDIPTVNMSVIIDGSLGEINQIINSPDLDYIEALEIEAAKVAKKEIDSVVEKAQYLRADFLGLSTIIHNKNPKKWKKIEKDWESIFPNVKFNTNVKVNINKSGLKL